MNKVYVSETQGSRRRGKPVVRWKDRIKEYMHERVTDRGGGLEQARRVCMDSEKWLCLWGIFLEGVRHQSL